MASVARFEGDVSARRAMRLPRAVRADAAGLAAFRVMAEVECGRSLSTLIESEIIPRLMVAHACDTSAAPATAGDASIAADEVDALAPLALQVEADELLAHVEAVLARGVSVETLLVDLLAPTARLLGEFWKQDRCDFVDVTMGLWRLQEVVHEITARAPVRPCPVPGDRHALFTAMPGDQHSFGTLVIDEVFRRDGWTTDRLDVTTTSDLLRRVGDEWFDLVGLTTSCDCHIAPLASIIVALREVSRNPRLCVMVGGGLFVADPQLALRVGADGTARDARLALKTASDLVRVRQGESLVCS